MKTASECGPRVSFFESTVRLVRKLSWESLAFYSPCSRLLPIMIPPLDVFSVKDNETRWLGPLKIFRRHSTCFGGMVRVVFAHYGPTVRDVLPHIVLPHWDYIARLGICLGRNCNCIAN